MIDRVDYDRSDSFNAGGERATALSSVADALARIGVTGAVLAARGGKVLIARSIGVTDSSDPLTANSLFEIASASKQFTASALVLLAQRGRVNLDGSIGDYLAGIPGDCCDIAVRHLLNHTSGIPVENSPEGEVSLQELLALLLRGGPKHPPGTYFEYSNDAFGIAAAIIESVTGVGYTEFVSRELFRPAGMQTALFTGGSLPMGVTQAMGRSGGGRSRAALDHPYFSNYGWHYKGMGGAVVNVWDLWAWDRALHQSVILSERGKRELFTVSLGNHALGWYVETHEGRLSHAHSGGVRGFKSMVVRYPDDDGAVFVLLNHDRLNPLGIAALFQDALFDRVPRLPPRPLDKSLQDALIGHFVDSSGAEFEFEADGPVTYAYRYREGRRAAFWTSSGYIGLTEEGVPVLYEWKPRGSAGVIVDVVQIPIHVSRYADGVVQLRIGQHETKRLTGVKSA